MTAPIALFVYNRPAHTRLTVDALLDNSLACYSDLIIFSDAPKSQKQVDAVNEVRQYIHQIVGFKTVVIIERETNFGLARSIIDGVTSVVKKHGRIIVLEDDVVVAPHFLSFMNSALKRYANENRIWHISGWNYPIDATGLGKAFLLRLMNCWGWATWADRWQYFRKEPGYLLESWSKDTIKRFNLDDAYGFWTQVAENSSGKMNTWAVFWYATIFEHDGLCVNPTRTLVKNIGHDGSGENCLPNDFYTDVLSDGYVDIFPSHLEESRLAVRRIKAFYTGSQGSVIDRFAFYVKDLLSGS